MNCVHHFILEDFTPSSDSYCKKCGIQKRFSGGWTIDDYPVDKEGNVIAYYEMATTLGKEFDASNQRIHS